MVDIILIRFMSIHPLPIIFIGAMESGRRKVYIFADKVIVHIL